MFSDQPTTKHGEGEERREGSPRPTTGKGRGGRAGTEKTRKNVGRASATVGNQERSTQEGGDTEGEVEVGECVV